MGTPRISNSDLEFCAECGGLVARLNEQTGWCDDCSKELGYITPSCPSCGVENETGKLCSRCKYEFWLERNADAIERVMAIQSVSVRVARRVVQADNRPKCKSCGHPIKGGTKGRSLFCTKRPECVKAHNTYTYHRRSKSQSEALELAITASIIYKLTANISNRELQE